MDKQRGYGFNGWLMGLCAGVFVLVTLAKLVPAYVQFYTVRTLLDDMASNTADDYHLSVRRLRSQLESYLDVNSLDSVEPEQLTVVKFPDNGGKALQVAYEVRRHWIGNIDFLLKFEYTTEKLSRNP